MSDDAACRGDIDVGCKAKGRGEELILSGDDGDFDGYSAEETFEGNERIGTVGAIGDEAIGTHRANEVQELLEPIVKLILQAWLVLPMRFGWIHALEVVSYEIYATGFSFPSGECLKPSTAGIAFEMRQIGRLDMGHSFVTWYTRQVSGKVEILQ